MPGDGSAAHAWWRRNQDRVGEGREERARPVWDREREAKRRFASCPVQTSALDFGSHCLSAGKGKVEGQSARGRGPDNI